MERQYCRDGTGLFWLESGPNSPYFNLFTTHTKAFQDKYAKRMQSVRARADGMFIAGADRISKAITE